MAKANIPETGLINYDELLEMFVSDDDIKPSMKQPNRVGNEVYATDAYSLIIIPADKVSTEYPAHENVPNYGAVLTIIKECAPVRYKDTDLFKVLESCPKEYATTTCDTCEGEGVCSHCGAGCLDCDGMGYVDDPSVPMVHKSSGVGVRIGKQLFAPKQLARLKRVLLSTYSEIFDLVGQSDVSTLFSVGGVRVLIARLTDELDPLSEANEIFDLHPLKSKP